jgi:CO/xanthine dehydrogenase FAD-binding subunit
VRSDVRDFELVPAASVKEACALVDAGYRPLAGGTDVMVLLSAGKLAHTRWVDLWSLDELRGIEVRDHEIALGALTTYTDVRRHPVASVELPLLCQAARETGGIAIQNRGTLGGNIANASPAADSPPALLAYDAEVELVSSRGMRRVPYATFHTGYKKTVAVAGELVARVFVPRAERASLYRKVGPRRAQAISKVCFAGCVERRDGRVVAAGIALGGVAPVPLRVPAVERAIVAREPLDEVLRALDGAIVPIDDIRSSARYRRRVAGNMLREFLAHVGLAS